MNIAMMKLLRLMLVVFAIGFSAKSNAAVSCGAWVKPDSEDIRFALETYVLGYLNGIDAGLIIALGKNNVFIKSDSKSSFLWIDNYCSKNPLSDLDTGILELVSELKKKMPNG